jgi:anthranilate phosphoribosyltransferase
MRRHALRVPRRTTAPLVDTCGTGGDGANTFNISTTAAFVVAGAGVPVAKHGNRAASSRCGSADVLEGLGVRVDLAPDAVAACIDEVGIGFMFAQVFHPAMRFAGPVRKEIAIRTIFNILGPLTNPAGAEHQVVGVPTPEVAEKMARALGMLGTRHALIVHSREGLDELSLNSPNLVSEVRVNGQVDVRTYELRAEDLGLTPAPVEQLRGGDVEDNVALTRHVLSGGNGAPRAVTLLNAGAAIYAADRAPSIAAGIRLAAESIDSGAALARLEALVELSNRLAQA